MKYYIFFKIKHISSGQQPNGRCVGNVSFHGLTWVAVGALGVMLNHINCILEMLVDVGVQGTLGFKDTILQPSISPYLAPTLKVFPSR